jgi:hypothetical protein
MWRTVLFWSMWGFVGLSLLAAAGRAYVLSIGGPEDFVWLGVNNLAHAVTMACVVDKSRRRGLFRREV